jgi:hypothetical protein
MLFVLGLWVLGHSIQEDEKKNKTLQFNEQKWQANKPTFYSYEVSSGCMWLVRYKIEQTQFGLFSTPLDNSPDSELTSINDLFQDAREANLTAYKVSVEYHPYFGFPTLIDVDWKKEIIDDECFVKIENFEVLDRNET